MNKIASVKEKHSCFVFLQMFWSNNVRPVSFLQRLPSLSYSAWYFCCRLEKSNNLLISHNEDEILVFLPACIRWMQGSCVVPESSPFSEPGCPWLLPWSVELFFFFSWLADLWLSKITRNSITDTFPNCLLALLYLFVHLAVLLFTFLFLSFCICISGFWEVLVQHCHHISCPGSRVFCLLFVFSFIQRYLCFLSHELTPGVLILRTL